MLASGANAGKTAGTITEWIGQYVGLLWLCPNLGLTWILGFRTPDRAVLREWLNTSGQLSPCIRSGPTNLGPKVSKNRVRILSKNFRVCSHCPLPFPFAFRPRDCVEVFSSCPFSARFVLGIAALKGIPFCPSVPTCRTLCFLFVRAHIRPRTLTTFCTLF